MRDYFFSRLDAVMKSEGFCCGRWYDFKMRAIRCSGKAMCVIKTNLMKYYRYKEWTYCQKCFSRQGSVIELDEPVDKSSFKEYQWIAKQPERLIECRRCHKKLHQICCGVLDTSIETFVCKNCDPNHTQQINASQLPETECDKFISNLLKESGVNENDAITLRVMSKEKKPLIIPSAINRCRQNFHRNSYTECSLYMFYKTPLGDVCILSVYFNLFDDDCDDLMRKSVYISFIDSVRVLKDDCRRPLNRLVLIGLFKFFKAQGYDKIFIWSVPSKENNDYIFHMKPQINKNKHTPHQMPQDKLNKWYHDLFQLGKSHGVIGKFINFTRYAAKNVRTLGQFPFFQGDIWSTTMAEGVTEIQKRHDDAKKKLTNLKTIRAHRPDGKTTKMTNSMMRLKENIDNFDLKKAVMERMNEQVQLTGNDYFVLTLTGKEFITCESMQNFKALDIKSQLFGDRLELVDFLWSKNLEFSSGRRAAYSTKVLIHSALEERSTSRRRKRGRLELEIDKTRFVPLNDAAVFSDQFEIESYASDPWDVESGSSVSPDSGHSSPGETESNCDIDINDYVDEVKKELTSSSMYDSQEYMDSNEVIVISDSDSD